MSCDKGIPNFAMVIGGHAVGYELDGESVIYYLVKNNGVLASLDRFVKLNGVYVVCFGKIYLQVEPVVTTDRSVVASVYASEYHF